VAIVYGSLVVFSIFFQVGKHFFVKKTLKKLDEEEI
jgi:hypothetical protein